MIGHTGDSKNGKFTLLSYTLWHCLYVDSGTEALLNVAHLDKQHTNYWKWPSRAQTKKDLGNGQLILLFTLWHCLYVDSGKEPAHFQVSTYYCQLLTIWF